MNIETEDLSSYDVVPKRVQRLLAEGKNVMLHGAAGTGKSTILRAITNHHKNAVVLAPTGIAALNVGGQTLHSFLGLSFGYLQPADINGCPRNLRVLQKRPLLIIDEVSMVRSDVFNAIDIALRKTLYSLKVFSGLQVLLLGDTGQLPPVVTANEERFFDNGSEMFFNSNAYKRGDFQHVELETVHRQTSEHFINFLMRVRNKSVKQADIDWFNSKISIASTKQYFETCTDESTVLCMTNLRADDYNQQMYDRLDGKERLYQAQVSGKFNEAEYPTQYELRLKPGTKVVMIRNSKEGDYVNGTVGIVSRLEPDGVYVNVRGRDVKVTSETWEKYSYVDSPSGIEKRVVGSFQQIPVKLAWAVTVHKSQGMTLSRFHLDLNRRPFTHGQMYVALSRARKAVGISSTRPIDHNDIIVDQSKLLS